METRRRFLGRIAGGVALAALGTPDARAQHGGSSLSRTASADFNPDVELEMTAAPDDIQLFPGEPTRVWRFTGNVLKGDPEAFSTLPDSIVPVMRFRTGQKVRIFFHNRLPQESIVHWHGLHIIQKMDGHPMYAIEPRERYVYEFTVNNRAGTYWFHPHPHRITGVQVYAGLAGFLIVEDEHERQLGLPSGEFERAWVLQDRLYDESNQLIYASHHMTMMMGFTGDRILINGRPDYVEQVAAAAYRVRVLNGSNSRFYKLAWSDARPLTVIGADGGLLERPIEKPYVMMAPGERVDLWLDFSGDEIGSERVLSSLPFDPGSMGMMGRGRGRGRGMMGMITGIPNGDPFDVLKVRIDREGPEPHPLPSTLSEVPWPNIDDAINRAAPRTVHLEMTMGMGRGMGVSLNGRVFEMTGVAPEETVQLGTTEIWEFVNDSPMSHPMHLHNLQFKILDRQHDPRYAALHDTMREGLMDEGYKDVLIVMPGERVRILMRFEDYTGLYLYHCHILEHEDLGMMRNYLVEA